MQKLVDATSQQWNILSKMSLPSSKNTELISKIIKKLHNTIMEVS